MRTSRKLRRRVTSSRMMMIRGCRDSRANLRLGDSLGAEDRDSEVHLSERPLNRKGRVLRAEAPHPRARAGRRPSRGRVSPRRRRWIPMIQTLTRRTEESLRLEEGSRRQAEEVPREAGVVDLPPEAGAEARDSLLQARAGAGEDPPREQGRQDR